MPLNLTNFDNSLLRLINSWATGIEDALTTLNKRVVGLLTDRRDGLLRGFLRCDGRVITYNNQPVEGLGFPVIRKIVTTHYDNTGFGDTLFHPVSKNTLYRVTMSVTCTEASAGGSVDVDTKYIDAETAQARTLVGATFDLSATGNASPAAAPNVWIFNADADTSLFYSGTLTAGAATPEYTVYVVLEELQ